jgi:cysteine synthase B
MESAIVPPIYDPTLADEDIRVGTLDAQDITRRLARQEGILVGVSSGANLAAAIQVGRNTSDAVIVTIFCDGGEKYLSERFWDGPPEGPR